MANVAASIPVNNRPDTRVFHRHTHSHYPTATQGEGVYIIDQNGKYYLDACCGAAVSCLGHSNDEVRDAIHQQVDSIAFAHTGFFTNEPAEQLADHLTRLAPEGLNHVYFVSGGSEAVESALKLARQYFVEIGKPEKSKFIARWQSYHGNTIGALSAGGNRWRRAQFSPMLVDMIHIPPCYPYRDKREDETEYAYGQRVANRLEETILHEGASNIAAFICEPVVGATMGAVPAVDGYLKRIREICDQYDVLLILDEVMCGMGRTGSYYACETDDIVPDMITVAKGLGGGYQPIGALLCQDKIFDAIYNGSGFFQHGHTYLAHPVACAAALKVQQIIERDNLVARVQEQGNKLKQKLMDAFGAHPHIGDIRGSGLFLGLELVQDRATKDPFPQESAIHTKIKKTAMERGLMIYPMGGTIDGKNGAHILIAPPFIIEEKHMDELITKLSESLSEVLA